MTSPVADGLGPPLRWAEVSKAVVDSELERIAESNAFRRSPRHVRFLRHLVQRAIDGDFARLREIVLAVEVFTRNASRFDPRRDTIVRVEARRLRQKLARYYEEEGAEARLRFVLPTRSYLIAVHRPERRRAAMSDRGSVAILPFASDAASDRAFVAGLAGELSAALIRLNGLRVVAGPNAEAVDANDPLPGAQKLGVASVLRGSARIDGDDFSMDLDLVRADDRATLWSRSTSARQDDAPRTLEALARAIVGVLHRDAEERRLRKITLAGHRPYVRSADNGEARDLIYRAHWCLRDQTTASYRNAIDLFERALALTDAANAWSGLAHALVLLVGMTVLPSTPTMESARRAAMRAVELEPELGEGWGVLGHIFHTFDRDWPRAEAALLNAVRFDPGRAGAHSRYGWSLMFNRRYAEARIEFGEARALAPVDLGLRTHEALISLYERDYERADAELAKVLEIAPEQPIPLNLRAALHLYAGHYEEGRAAYAALLETHPSLSIGHCGLAQAAALLGDIDAARDHLAFLRSAFDEGQCSPYQIAMVYARMDRVEDAFSWLRRAAELRDFNFVCAPVDPAFDVLRADSRWPALLAQTGFAHLSGAESARH